MSLLISLPKDPLYIGSNLNLQLFSFKIYPMIGKYQYSNSDYSVEVMIIISKPFIKHGHIGHCYLTHLYS